MDFLVIGLGNPGREYATTRHNIGWRVLDALTSNWKMENKFKAEISTLILGGKKIVFVKPQTFMNLSGESVRAISDFYKVSPAHILTVSDDVDLPFGTLRIRPGGGSGGHNGLKSIMQHLGTDQFPRLKIGVRNPLLDETPIETADFVLGRFTTDEEKLLPAIIKKAVEAITAIITTDLGSAMNQYNERIA